MNDFILLATAGLAADMAEGVQLVQQPGLYYDEQQDLTNLPGHMMDKAQCRTGCDAGLLSYCTILCTSEWVN